MNAAVIALRTGRPRRDPAADAMASRCSSDQLAGSRLVVMLQRRIAALEQQLAACSIDRVRELEYTVATLQQLLAVQERTLMKATRTVVEREGDLHREQRWRAEEVRALRQSLAAQQVRHDERIRALARRKINYWTLRGSAASRVRKLWLAWRAALHTYSREAFALGLDPARSVVVEQAGENLRDFALKLAAGEKSAARPEKGERAT
ncbi:MAG TPA: hypothetical protein VJV78_32365 [Polyangiales bacterium]|nr:hypothetical protein [Polyangiales bacterium]